jgi:hypothetical protein
MNPGPQLPAPGPQIPSPSYACLYQPPAPDIGADAPDTTLEHIARDFSPRYECHSGTLVSIDVSGLDRLLGPPQVIGEELRRVAASRSVRAHVAVAGTRMAALVLARARPGITVVAPGNEADALAAVPIGILQHIMDIDGVGAELVRPADARSADAPADALSVFKRWGLKTFGELAALPRADLMSRLGRRGLLWQAIARGQDVRPLIPTLEEERFESTLELEWPIEGLEPLSFVLTRLLESLSTRLERRDPPARHARAVRAAARAAVADTRRAGASDAGATRSRITSAGCGDRSRQRDHRSDTGTHPAAHAVHACASHAGAALHASCTARRPDGSGPPRRTRDGRFVPPGRIRDGAVCDRSRRSTQNPWNTQRRRSTKFCGFCGFCGECRGRRGFRVEYRQCPSPVSPPRAGARRGEGRSTRPRHHRPPQRGGWNRRHLRGAMALVGKLVGGGGR